MSRTFSRLALLGLALLAAVPGCRKAPPPPPAPAQGSGAGDPGALALALLAKGHKLLASDLAAATAELNKAQQLKSYDPDILAELGLAQLLAGEFDRALETTSAALRAAETPAQTGAPAYTLGRLEESAGHLDRAVSGYELAAAARPSRALRTRLQALKAIAGQGQPQPLLGPFGSLPALCTALKAPQQSADSRSPEDGGCTEACAFACPLQELGSLTTGLPPRMDEVRVFWSRLNPPGKEPAGGPAPETWSGEPHCGFVNAAVRLGKQWYAASALASFCRQGPLQGAVKLTRIASETAGAGKLVALELSATEQDGAVSTQTQSLTLLGIGRSGKPARLGPVLRSVLTEESAADKADRLKMRDLTTYDWRLADGALAMSEQTMELTAGPHKSTRKSPLTLRYSLALP